MLFTNDIEEIVKLAIASRYFTNESPVNLLLVCEPESGKTEILSAFQDIKNVHYTTDIVYRNLLQSTLFEIKEGKIKTLMVPDFIKVISKSKSTASNIVTVLLGLLEEGIKNIDVGIPIRFKHSVRCNLITAITKGSLISHYRHWINIGFLSRFIIISFRYTNEQSTEISKHIAQQKHIEKVIKKIQHPTKQIILPEKHVYQLMPFIKSYAKKENTRGWRFQARLQTLLKTSALLDKRDAVNQKDVNKLLKLLRYANTDMNELI